MEQLKIWYLISEVAPFAKTGGLGDVGSSFTKSLKNNNLEIRLMMPKYKIINERKYILREVIRLKDIPVSLGDVTIPMNAKSAFLPDSKVQIYFVEMPDFFGRTGLYGDVNTGIDYSDNAERFAYFCRGCLETLKILSWCPDIIHCNDWQTALVPIYLKTLYQNDEFFKNIKTVFTIHNLAYQGIYDKDFAKKIGILPELVETDGPLELNGKINLIKGAIHYSDWVTTVSPNYANEILNKKDFGFGLEKDLKQRGEKFSGLLNGVDYSVWSPEVDKFIPFKYSSEDLSDKVKNKQALLNRVNLEYKEKIPVIGMISRIVEQKGYGILVECLEELLSLNLQLIILGSGDKKIEKQLDAFQKKHPDLISVNPTFDETFAHMIEAGSDFFLMPSNFEPCGMNQMYSLRYGTIPIVFKVGGLADTIQEINIEEGTGNGIVFDKYKAKELVKAIKRALKIYKKTDDLQTLIPRLMNEDFSWDESTDEYLDIYHKILA
jgi:starch synthase